MFKGLTAIPLCLLLFTGVVPAAPAASPDAENHARFGMQAVFIAAPGKGSELAEIMLEASKVVSGLEGCEVYIVQQSLDDESKVLITEVWQSKEAHRASLSNARVRTLIAKARPILSGMEHYPARYIGGHGL